MATLLYRLGSWAARRRRAVLAGWLLVLIAAGAGALGLSGTFTNSFSIPGTPAQAAMDELSAEIPGFGASSGRIVISVPAGGDVTTPENQQVVTDLLRKAVELEGVTSVSNPFDGQNLIPGGDAPANALAKPTVSPDKRIALSTVQMAGQLTEVPEATQNALEQLAKAASVNGLQVDLGGAAVPQQPAIGSTEALGVIVALVVLLITFGSVVAAGLPMLTALIGVAVGMSGVLLVSGFVEMSSTAPILALMIGLAVGIDYALFISSRHRQQVADGMNINESIARATGTAGSAVVFAGLTVIIALAALSVVGIPFLTIMGLAAAVTVAIAVLIAITLVPALLGFAGEKILGRKARATLAAGTPAVVSKPNRWITFVTKYPVAILIVGVLGLGAATLPATGLHLSLPDDGAAAPDTTKRQAYDLVSEGFGPGLNGPLVVTVKVTDPAQLGGVVDQTLAILQATPDIVTQALPLAGKGPAEGGATVSPSGTLAVLPVIPLSGPSEVATEDLVHAIRAQTDGLSASSGALVSVTGQTAVVIDVSEKLSGALPIYLLIVVGLALILLMLVFRSIVVPLTAALGFLLSVGAVFGVVVAIYQFGWFGIVETPAPIVSFLPILLIGVLFGLAMDYQVFLVSGMREAYVHGATPKKAVTQGFSNASRVVTAAAIIMTSVFAGFILAPDTIIASIGFALGLGVLVDAFIVRMTLIPAVMSVLGKSAWYLPKWLDRILPNVDIEGEQLLKSLPKADPEPHHGRHER